MRFLHEHLVAKFCDLIAAGYDDSHEKIIQGKTYTVGPFTEDDVVALAIIPEDFQVSRSFHSTCRWAITTTQTKGYVKACGRVQCGQC